LKAIKTNVIVLVFHIVFFGAAFPVPQVEQFSGKSAFRYLEKQCSFGPRNPGSDGHAACLEFLTGEFRKFTPHVSIQDFLHRDRKLNKTLEMHNIYVQFPGKRPRAQRILFVAHWDTRPMADRDPDPEKRNMPLLGANDGASGVAILLELGRMMSENPPPVPVDILLTDGEDYGEEGQDEHYLLGARHFAKNLPRTPYKFGILLDLVGDSDLRIPKEINSLEMLPDLVDKVWKRASKLRLPAFVNTRGDRILDDHIPLLEAGVPIIDIIDFDYEFWHTVEDTPDKCSPGSLEQVGRLVTSLVYEGL